MVLVAFFQTHRFELLIIRGQIAIIVVDLAMMVAQHLTSNGNGHKSSARDRVTELLLQRLH